MGLRIHECSYAGPARFCATTRGVSIEDAARFAVNLSSQQKILYIKNIYPIRNSSYVKTSMLPTMMTVCRKITIKETDKY